MMENRSHQIHVAVTLSTVVSWLLWYHQRSTNLFGPTVPDVNFTRKLDSVTVNSNSTIRTCSKFTCLLNKPSGLGEIMLNASLQSTFSLDEQCRMEFGEGYSLCRAFDIIETCSHLWCGHIKSPLVCKTKKGPPLEGTECGFDKVKVCRMN